MTGTGKGSGVRVQQTAGMVYWLRDGKISTMDTYATKATLSKPWGCRSKTLTPTPEPAGSCAGESQENVEGLTGSKPHARRRKRPK